MTLLDKHLEQIEQCSTTISTLPFPPPRIFTNAMLHNHDITALIRDTEVHERSLFSLAVPEKSSKPRASMAANKRQTVFNNAPEAKEQENTFRAPRKGTAVAAVLGCDLHDRIGRQFARSAQDGRGEARAQKDDLDVELLLQGAEKLCSVYPIAGGIDRITALRARNYKVLESMAKYEDLVSEQSRQLGKMNRPSSFGFQEDDDIAGQMGSQAQNDGVVQDGYAMTLQDLRLEEEEIKELELKKRTLEERVSGMEKDLGGLMR